MAPANDTFAAGEVITGSFGSVDGTTVGAAAAETGEPAPFPGNKRTIWYRWTAPATGTVRFRARGVATLTGLPDAVAVNVYTGSAVNALTAVDDGIVSGDFGYSYPVTAGTTYHLQIQFKGQQGTFPFAPKVGPITLTWNALTPSPIQYHGSSAASAAASTVSIAAPAATAPDDAIIVFVAANTGTTLAMPAGWGLFTAGTNEWGSFGGGIGSGTMWTFVAARVADAADVAGASHSFTVSGATQIAAVAVAYKNVWADITVDSQTVPIPMRAPGFLSGSAYRSSGYGGGSGTGGPSGLLTAYVPDTVELDADATEGGSGGALTITSGAVERGRVDGALPLVVSEGPASWAFPSANQIFVFRLLLAPDEPFGELPTLAVGGWGVGMVRMGAN